MEHPVPPTPTQYALFLCFFVFGPAMGVMAAYLAHGRQRSAPLAALVTLGSSWAGWVVSSVCAAVIFPTYPQSGVPSEPWAMTFVLPGFAIGGLSLAWVRRSGFSARTTGEEIKAGTAITALAVLVGAGLVRLHIEGSTWPARRELPADAVVLREDILIDSFIGDFAYTLEARMTRDAFLEWMRALSLECMNDDEGGVRCRSPDSSPSTQLVDVHGAYGTWADGVGHFHAFST